MEIREEGDEIVIRFKKEADLGPSRTGKTRVVASTFGNIQLAPGLYVGLTAFRPNDEDTVVPAHDIDVDLGTVSKSRARDRMAQTDKPARDDKPARSRVRQVKTRVR